MYWMHWPELRIYDLPGATPPTLLIGYAWEHKLPVARAKANCDPNGGSPLAFQSQVELATATLVEETEV